MLLLNHTSADAAKTRKYIHVLESMVLPEFVDVVVCEMLPAVNWKNEA